MPLSRLGVPETPAIDDVDCLESMPYPELRGFFFATLSALRCFKESRRLAGLAAACTSEEEVAVESGLGGRLDTLGPPFGGRGNAPMLVVLRNVFPGVGMPEDGVVDDTGEVAFINATSAVFSVGTAGVDRDFGVGRPDEVTDRVILAGGRPSCDVKVSLSSGMSGSGFLVLGIGSAGSGPEGGDSGDVEGCRMPVAGMVVVADSDMFVCVLHSSGLPPSNLALGALRYPSHLRRKQAARPHISPIVTSHCCRCCPRLLGGVSFSRRVLRVMTVP